MCHGGGSLNGDGFDLDDGKLLAVTAFAFHALALLFLEDDDLLGALVFQNLGGHGSTGEERSADLEARAFTGCEDFVNFDGGAGFRLGIAIYNENVALANRELFPLCFDSGFHKFKGSK